MENFRAYSRRVGILYIDPRPWLETQMTKSIYSSLEVEARKLAESHAKKTTKDRTWYDGNDEIIAKTSYLAGFNKACDLIESRVGEFDQTKFANESLKWDKEYWGTYELFVDGARWSHEQVLKRLRGE